MTLGIIGVGNMGKALCQAFIKQGAIDAQDILACDLNADKLSTLQASLGVSTTNDLNEVISCDVLLIAVKPQGFPSLAKEIEGKILTDTVLVSIMAALPIETIQERTGHKKVIRCMPNTPALVEEGVLAWSASPEVTGDEKTAVDQLLDSAGFAFEVETEENLNDVTYISGSGPGFFFYIIESWLKATGTLKLPNELRKTLLMKTLKGSLTLAEDSEEDFESLRNNVSSKGGITEAGLEILKDAQIDSIFADMISAAAKRNEELSKTDDNA